MKALEEKILKEGKVFPGDVLNVSSFLNHQIDARFAIKMGEEIARLFEGKRIDKVLTIESSGIVLGLAAASVLDVPMVFAKKHRSANISANVFASPVHSYTHNTDYTAIVNKDFLKKGERVLIVDDFLANGAAANGLIDIVEQSGAILTGIAVAIEKGFQKGGKELRKKGIHLESLAIIETMTENSLTFRQQTVDIEK